MIPAAASASTSCWSRTTRATSLMTREAFEDNKVANRLTCVADGVEAIELLRREGEYADAPRPDLILLDLNLPRKDGREVLAEIKADDDLRAIPVVVLTTSAAEEDILRSYDLHANAYVTKPVDFDQFIDDRASDRRLLRVGRQAAGAADAADDFCG